MRSILTFSFVVALLFPHCQRAASEGGSSLAISAEESVQGWRDYSYSLTTTVHLRPLRELLEKFPESGCSVGAELYSALLKYYNAHAVQLSDIRPMERREMAGSLSFENYCALRCLCGEMARLNYLAFVGRQAQALVLVRGRTFTMGSRPLAARVHDAADALLDKILLPLYTLGPLDSLNDVYPLLFSGSMQVRVVCSQIVRVLQRDHFSLYVYARDTHHHLCSVLKKVVDTNSKFLSADRERLSCINEVLSLPEDVAENFAAAVKANNTAVDLLAVGQEVEHIKRSSAVIPTVDSWKRLKDLGDFLYSWEVKAIEAAVNTFLSSTASGSVYSLLVVLRCLPCVSHLSHVCESLRSFLLNAITEGQDRVLILTPVEGAAYQDIELAPQGYVYGVQSTECAFRHKVEYLLERLPATGWLEGEMLYYSLLNYYNFQLSFFSGGKTFSRMSMVDFVPFQTYSNYVFGKKECVCLKYIAFTASQVQSLISVATVLDEVGDEYSSYAAKARMFLCDLLGPLGVVMTGETARDLYPLLFDCSINIEEGCSEIVGAIDKISFYDFPAYCGRCFPKLQLIVEKAIENNSYFLSRKRDRLCLISENLSLPNGLFERFMSEVQAHNRVVRAAGVGVAVQPIKRTTGNVITLENIKKLEELGDRLYIWEEEVIVKKVKEFFTTSGCCARELCGVIDSLSCAAKLSSARSYVLKGQT